MLRNWKTIALCSLFTSAVVLQAPAPAVAQDKGADSKALLERLDKLSQAIEESFKGVGADMKNIKDDLKKATNDALGDRIMITSATSKLEQMEAALKKLAADLEAFKKKGPEALAGGAGLDRSAIDEIKDKLGAIEAAILKLAPSSTRTALAAPSPAGRIVLLNLHPEELLFLVNDKGVRVPPGQNVTLENIPAGTLNYEVFSERWGARGRKTSTLAANETLTLTAR